MFLYPLHFSEQHLSYDGWWLEGKIINQNCLLLYCVRQLCAMICTHICEQLLNLHVGLSLDFVFVCLFRFSILCFLC